MERVYTLEKTVDSNKLENVITINAMKSTFEQELKRTAGQLQEEELSKLEERLDEGPTKNKGPSSTEKNNTDVEQHTQGK